MLFSMEKVGNRVCYIREMALTEDTDNNNTSEWSEEKKMGILLNFEFASE